MITRKLIVLVIVVAMALTVGCKGGGGGGGSDKNDKPKREFKIKDHELLVGDKDCFIHYDNLGYGLEDIADVCGYYAVKGVVMDYEHVYGVRYYTVNDQRNTRYLHMEIFDVNHTLEKAHTFEFDLNGQPKDAVLVPYYVFWLEPDGNSDPVFTVDTWLTDANGVETSVYTFDIETIE